MTFVVKGWPSQDNYHDLSFAEVHIIFRLEEHFYRLEKGPHCLFVFALTKLDWIETLSLTDLSRILHMRTQNASVAARSNLDRVKLLMPSPAVDECITIIPSSTTYSSLNIDFGDWGARFFLIKKQWLPTYKTSSCLLVIPLRKEVLFPMASRKNYLVNLLPTYH